MSPKPVPAERRREIFQALVEAQDAGQTVPASRAAVAARFAGTAAQLRAIEDEGTDQEWPPL